MGNTFQRAAPVNLEANREDEEGPSEGVQPVRAQKRYVSNVMSVTSWSFLLDGS